MAKGLTASKAKKILEDGTVRGKALTEKQKKFFGAVAGGATPLKKLNGGWLDKFAMGGSLPGASGMMYARTSGTSPEEPKKAQDGHLEDGFHITVPEKWMKLSEAAEKGFYIDTPDIYEPTPVPGSPGLFYAFNKLKKNTSTVEYGTPEYEAAYREGRFKDVPNPLDEVVITAGVDYEKYPLYDKLSAQQKEYFNDPGPIGRGVRRAAQTDRGLAEDTKDMVTGMLVQQPLSALQTPQSLMVEGIEALRGRDANFLNALTFDTQRTPSQAFNIQNPYGALALDVIADPLNVVGVGLARNPIKSAVSAVRGNLGKYRVATELTQSPAVAAKNRALEWTNTPGFQTRYENIMKPAIDANLSSKTIRSTEQAMSKGKETAARLDDLVKEKETMQRLGKSNVVASIDDEIQQLTKDLSYYDMIIQGGTNMTAPNVGRSNLRQIQETGKFTEVLRPVGDDIDYYAKNPKTLGFYSGVENRANLNLDRLENLVPGDVARNFKTYTAIGHENRHAMTSGNRALNKETKDQIRQAINSRGSLSKREFDMLPEKDQNYLNYLAKETEVDARVMEIRDNYPEYFKPGTYDVSDSMIDKIIREGKAGNLTVDKKFFNLIKDKEAFKNLFKILPAAAPVGVGLGTATQMKDGGRCWPGYKTVPGKTPFSKGSCQKAQDGYMVPPRKGVRKNPDGSESTHLMKAEQLEDGTWVGFPSLFQNTDGKWIDMSGEKDWMNIYNEALNRGEVVEFGKDKEAAIKFGKGSWKSPKMKNGGWLDKFQEGGVIEDNRGQLAYPGKITKINSNNITMKGVNYPVLGVSDTGDTKIMQPGVENYTFDGNSVTEFPMAQRGMNVEGQKQKKWFDSYIRSDKYLERLGKEFPEMNADQLANERWARLMNMRSTPIGFLPESSEISPEPGSTQGVYNADEYPGKIMLRPEYSEGRQGPWSYNTIPLHELGHAVDEGGERIPQTTLDFLMPKLKQNPYDIPKETFYYTRPDEYINRLQPLRYLLQEEGIYDAKKKDFTKEDLQKAKENTRIKYNRHFKDLMENTESEEDLIEIMNTIAANPQMQQNTMVAKDGKSLVELNQLTNFTNYNTPQPGGWLDKYH